MARPVQPRSAESYMREVQNLCRLRNAIALDTRMGEGARNKALNHIDELVNLVRELSGQVKEEASAAE